MAYRKALPPAGGLMAPIKSQQQSEQEAQQLLSRFGSQILEMLKAGGKKLDNFDRAYVNKIQQDTPKPSTFRGLTTQVPLGDVVAAKYAYGGDPRIDTYMNAMTYGAGAANIASRYALPAGGVMLAGQGLADLTNGLYDAASEQPIL